MQASAGEARGAEAREPLRRCAQWERELVAARADEMARPFAWSERDCCTTPCNVARALTGVDLAAGFRGRYHDRRGAERVMRAYAGGGVAETAARIAEEFGLPEVTVSLARRGDIVLFEAEHGPMLGVVDFDGVHALVRVRRGLQRLPLAVACKAWRVG